MIVRQLEFHFICDFWGVFWQGGNYLPDSAETLYFARCAECGALHKIKLSNYQMRDVYGNHPNSFENTLARALYDLQHLPSQSMLPANTFG